MISGPPIHAMRTGSSTPVPTRGISTRPRSSTSWRTTTSPTGSFTSSCVSKIARTIGRCLRLNEDLIEAIALGHDIGHIPYGHFGESCLSDLCEQHGIGKFFHNVQSVRFLDQIEDCDLTMQVLDGVLCHNGEADDVRIRRGALSGWLAFDKKVQDNADGRRSRSPMTLEGCVVKFADTIAYIGRDLQDAREVGLIGDGEDIPEQSKAVLGGTNREIINTLIYDLLENSETEDEGYISYSRDVETALIALRTFSREQIYDNPNLTADAEDPAGCTPPCSRPASMTWNGTIQVPGFLRILSHTGWTSPRYLGSATHAELVRDFIAGMTDRYFAKRYEECVIPKRTEGKFCAR